LALSARECQPRSTIAGSGGSRGGDRAVRGPRARPACTALMARYGRNQFGSVALATERRQRPEARPADHGLCWLPPLRDRALLCGRQAAATRLNLLVGSEGNHKEILRPLDGGVRLAARCVFMPNASHRPSGRLPAYHGSRPTAMGAVARRAHRSPPGARSHCRRVLQNASLKSGFAAPAHSTCSRSDVAAGNHPPPHMHRAPGFFSPC
jgi:hypothetical protein